jgi:hypothetical protein
MVYPDIPTSHLIGVETQAVLLPFFDFFANILVVLSFHAHVFFQLNITFCGTRMSQLIKEFRRTKERKTGKLDLQSCWK